MAEEVGGARVSRTMKKVLVIGAGGMLGREVARAAEAGGAEVVRTTRTRRAGWPTFEASRDDPEDLFGDQVDLVVNCAAVLAADIDPHVEATVEAAERVNADFPPALAAAAARHGTRLVHISTDAVFPEDAGTCAEDDVRYADDPYGSTKRRGEPDAVNALTIRCSFVGRDPARRRGLLEWLLAQPPQASVQGFTNQLWNGLAVTQLARVCVFLLDDDAFLRARAEGPVHHLFEGPPLTKCQVLELCAVSFGKDVTIVPTESGRPVTRVLASVHSTLRECLESGPARAAALAELAQRGAND
jgi:dTDP-4-dehydrorhamnose reductase